MRKSFLALGLSTIISFSFAQKGKQVSVWNYLQTYQKDKNPQDLEDAKTLIEEVVSNPETSVMGKTWWYRSEVFQFMASDEKLKAKYPDASLEALRSFQKLNEVKDPKFKDWDDAEQNMLALASTLGTQGEEAYKDKKFERGYELFKSMATINDIFDARNSPTKLDPMLALGNAALCAENAGKNKEAVDVYKIMFEKSKDPKFLHLIALLYKKMDKKEEYKTTVMEGVAKFPNDKDLLIDKVNLYISEDKTKEAIADLQALADKDPKNEQIKIVLAQAIEKTGDIAGAKKAYQSVIAVNPKNFDALYSLGAMIFNQAKTFTDQMNALGYSKEDQAKFEKLKAERAVIFNEAKPFLESAGALKPDDQSVKRALGNIKSLLGN